MSFEGADIPFVGPSYTAPLPLQDAETCINYYLERTTVEAPKMPSVLLGTPGLNPILATNTGQVRGMWALPGGTEALVVTGATVYLMTMTVPATQTSIAQFSIAPVGTLLTNSGPVSIRDNGVVFGGAGGYAVIVDGTYGYYYQIGGASTQTFIGSTNSTTSITPLGVQYYLVVGATITDTAGAIPPSTTVASVNYNAGTILLSNAATLTFFGDTFTVSIPAFGQITDPGFLGASRVEFIEGWLIFNNPGSRTFYTTGPVPYTLTFPGLFYALKDSSTDNLITLQANNRELWLVGERTTEVWYNAGNVIEAFSRLPGIGPQIGCSAVNSITRLGYSLLWLAKNEQGEDIVIATDQYTWRRVSNHAIEHAIASYPLVSDAIGYGYEDEGHLFYMLTFPTADVTWCYDLVSDAWHQRLSYDPIVGVYHRHRSNCYMDIQNIRVVGDYQTGQLHQMSRAYYTDAGSPLRAQRRTPHIWSRTNRKRVFMSSLQIEFNPGQGLQTGQGSQPQAMLRWSNDGGFTWSNEHWASVGPAGDYTNRAIWRRLGRARDRIYEVNFSDPVNRDIVGATMFGEAEEEAA